MTRDEIKERARQLKTEGAGRSNKAVRAILAEELPADQCPSLHLVSEWCRGLAEQRRVCEYTLEEAAEIKRIYQREYQRRRRQNPEHRELNNQRAREYHRETYDAAIYREYYLENREKILAQRRAYRRRKAAKDGE